MSDLKTKDQRRLMKLYGAFNVRDLGGYPATGGKYTQWEKYFRSDSIHRLPLESQEALIGKGIGLIIDLRFPYEGPYYFYKELGIKYVNIPLLDPANLKDKESTSLLDMYCDIIDLKQKSIYQIMQHIIAGQDKAILFHCASGKDRTGIISALLLDLAGVPHNIIAQNYALSAIYLQPLLKERRDRLIETYGIKDENILDCNPETMLEFLQYINKKYKNAEGYLKETGIDDWEIELVKRNFIGNENN
ncbi:tyrosine-protein phosphatase [Psychrobacillus sp. NPDC096426]|uniref:tyrosine-protein phosphatase n=1 Tax=Psychrobacillus sp. NPDC096426 TaxID=3364491 RepID=UPI00382AE7BC